MRFVKAFVVGLVLSLLVVAFLNSATPDQWNKKTVLTFSQPFEIPGKVLPAGKYVFKLVDSIAYRHIVQIWNADETQLLTTVLAIPNYRLTPTAESVLKFNERAGDSPEALRAWFYPGDSFGQEFVYPEKRAIELAEASNEIVPAEKMEPTESNLKTVPLVAITPQHKEESLTESIPVFPLQAQKTLPEAAPAAKELPKTATPAPMFGLFGVAAIAMALGLTWWGKKKLS